MCDPLEQNTTFRRLVLRCVGKSGLKIRNDNLSLSVRIGQENRSKPGERMSLRCQPLAI